MENKHSSNKNKLNIQGLSIKPNGNYQFRLRVNQQLKTFFKRTELKKTYVINNELTIGNIVDDVTKLKDEYQNIRNKMKVLTDSQLQQLVDKFIINNLNEDYEARVNGSFTGSFGVGYCPDNHNRPEEQALDVLEMLIDEQRENLSNPKEEINPLVVNELLATENTNLDELEDFNRKELMFKLKQANIKILQEQFDRAVGKSEANRLYLDTAPITIQAEDSLQNKLTIKQAVADYLSYYNETNPDTRKQTVDEKIKALEYFVLVMETIDVVFVDELRKTSVDIYVNKFLFKKPKQATAELRKLSLESVIEGIENNDFEDIEKISRNTVDKQYQHISGFCNYLFNDGLLDKKVNQARVGQELNNRDEFTTEEVKLVSDALHNTNKLYYMLYLTYCYSGLRNNELWQSTIKEEDGILYFDVKGTKSANAVRKVPVHSKLVELGITDSWISWLKNKFVTPKHIGRKINDFIKTVDGVDESKTLYSCRHLFTTELLRAEVAVGLVDKLTGHSDRKDLTINTYGKNAYTLKMLALAVEKLDYN